jgi:hypothetical protein
MRTAILEVVIALWVVWVLGRMRLRALHATRREVLALLALIVVTWALVTLAIWVAWRWSLTGRP